MFTSITTAAANVLSSIRSVHITNYYHRSSGGISTSYNNLLAAAGRLGRRMDLIVPGEKESVEQVNDYATIYYVPAKYSPVFDKRYRIMMPWQYMAGDSVIRRILLELEPDIIEVTDKYTLSFIGPMIRIGKFKRIGRPMLVHFSCERMDDNIGSFLSEGRLGKWFARRLMGEYLLPGYDFHIANSDYTAGEFFDAANAVSHSRVARKMWRLLRAPMIPLSERVAVCPRGVDAVQFTPERRSAAARQQIIREAGLPESAKIVLYAGRISPEKNVPLLLDAFRTANERSQHDLRLLVAGDGPLADKFFADGAAIGERKVIRLGHLDKASLADTYANADIFVHPNPREPFGIAPLEAMASGLPTVAPNGGGILSYATNDNIWLCDPEPEAFASAILEIADGGEKVEHKVARALDTARANTRERSTENLIATYDRLWQDFNERRSLYTDAELSAGFDHLRSIDA